MSRRDYLPPHYRPGDRVRVRLGLYDHVGTVADDGQIWAASRRFGTLCKVSPRAFSGGRPILNDGPGRRDPSLAVRDLERRAGERYSLLFNNCEHVTNRAHGLGNRSPQMDSAPSGLAVKAARFLLKAQGKRKGFRR